MRLTPFSVVFCSKIARFESIFIFLLLMNLILIVLLLACSAVYFHRSSYLGELAISFAPYRALLALIGLLICGWRLFIVFTKKQKI